MRNKSIRIYFESELSVKSEREQNTKKRRRKRRRRRHINWGYRLTTTKILNDKIQGPHSMN